jgi:hypothetical protein
MTWAKLCDTAHSHPKFDAAGLEATGLWALSLSHCSAYPSDGHVSERAALKIAGSGAVLTRLAKRLVDAGLWEQHPSGDGWQVHDYLDYQPSRAQVEVERAKKRQGGRDGAARRWGNSTHGATSVGQPIASPIGPPIGAPTGVSDAPVPSRPVPTRPDPLTPSESFALAPQAHPAQQSSKPKPKRERKHTDEEIAAQRAVLDVYVAAFEKAKGVRPKKIDAADHHAAFELARLYTVDELQRIFGGAFQDPFIVNGHATIRYVASKADSFRGAQLTKTSPRNMVQPAAPPGERGWEVGNGT